MFQFYYFYYSVIALFILNHNSEQRIFPWQVCGTDGKIYPSHCELHRAACIQGHPIAVDHSQKGCTKKATSPQKDKKKTRKNKSEKMDKSRVVQSSKYWLIQNKMLASSLFSRAVLCCLTWNSLGTEVSCRWHVDDVQTTCGQHKSEISLEIWLADDICHPEHRPQVGTSSAHCLQVCTSSACHLQHSSWSAWTWLSFYCDRNWLLDGICHNNVELFHFRIM